MPTLYYLPDDRLITALANRLNFAPKMRLVCQTQVSGPGKITLRRLALDVEDLELIHQQMTSKGRLGAIGEEKQIAILLRLIDR